MREESTLKLFLDANIDGMLKYLEALNIEATSASKEGISSYKNFELVRYAKKHNMIFVTKNDDAEKFAKMENVICVLLDMAFLAKALKIMIDTDNLSV